MAKWADYGISAVGCNQAETHIVNVKVHPDNGETIGAESVWTRNQVVSAIERGTTFVTILKNAEGKWTRGQDVHLVTVNRVKYIRTDGNSKAADNLENLPRF